MKLISKIKNLRPNLKKTTDEVTLEIELFRIGLRTDEDPTDVALDYAGNLMSRYQSYIRTSLIYQSILEGIIIGTVGGTLLGKILNKVVKALS